MGLLTFTMNVTIDGCVGHREGIADDETHALFTRLMDEGGAMLFGRVIYEMMESYWPAVARGDKEAPPAVREWAFKLEAKPKYVVSSTRTDFPWTNSHHIAGDLRTSVQKLKDATPAGVLLGSGKLATELDRLDLIDEYRFLVHPRIVGHGPTLYQGGLPSTRRLELVSATPLRNGAVAMHYRRARLTTGCSGRSAARPVAEHEREATQPVTEMPDQSVPPPGQGASDPYKKELDAVGFALERLQAHLHWATEHTATFGAKRHSEPKEADEELRDLVGSLREARRHFARLKELIMAGCAIDPEKQLPPNLSRPAWHA